jgi:hypothetical protein
MDVDYWIDPPPSFLNIHSVWYFSSFIDLVDSIGLLVMYVNLFWFKSNFVKMWVFLTDQLHWILALMEFHPIRRALIFFILNPKTRSSYPSSSSLCYTPIPLLHLMRVTHDVSGRTTLSAMVSQSLVLVVWTCGGGTFCSLSSFFFCESFLTMLDI